MKVTKEEFNKLKEDLSDFAQIKILTPSMSPLIQINDIIKVQKISPEDLRPYDIIVFWQSDKLICHFFIKKVGDKYLARGLNNKEYDAEIASEDILAKVIRPRVSNIKKFFLKYLLR